MKRIISLLLIVTLLFTIVAVTVNAASSEEFISEVSLIYEDSVEEALKKIEGTDWKLFESDLNANADALIDDGVYLIYKTSTNVEDAITDIRVMDMYGGYSISSYDRQLEATRAAYLDKLSSIRIAAKEFADLYAQGDEMARLAYRQMNYYKDKKSEYGTETDLLMGDFFLNLPTDDKIIQVLFEGNIMVASNLLTLLAVGIAGDDDYTLSARVAEKYAIKNTLTDTECYATAVLIAEEFGELHAKILRYDALVKEYKLDDENMTEEEFQFMYECGATVNLLKEVKLGNKTLADIVRSGIYSLKDLYPLAAAFSVGQKALLNIGMLETVLKFNSPSQSIDELTTLVENAEEKMKDENGNIPLINVYEGVDRSIFHGAFAMTNEAERQQALTGETWTLEEAAASSGLLIASYVVAGLGVVSAAAGLGIFSVVAFYNLVALLCQTFGTTALTYSIAAAGWKSLADAFMIHWGAYGWAGFVFAGAFVLVAAGMAGIALWYNYYNPTYTEIPNTLIDVRETDLGDKYVKYTAAKVFGDEEKNADFNAYEGMEWIALYYTKDANAGNCLIPKITFKENDSSIARRHQGVAMFGETEAFNLNSHVYNEDAKGAYLTIRYSTTKKAAADKPSVVASIFTTGALYAVTALGGAGVGVGAVLLIKRSKKTEEDEAPVEA